MNFQPYSIPATPVLFEEEIKKSRFITYLAHTPSIEAAKAFIATIKARHVDARHNCSAFIAGPPENSTLWGCSDDGEPSGTAGKPMLAQLAGSGIGEITAVVTRYYGGIRLGTGGLVKAYGGGVQQALKRLQINEKKITTKLSLTLDYNLLALAQSIMEQYEAVQIEAQYGEMVAIIIELPCVAVDVFTQNIINKSSAKILVTHVVHT
ncbi:YigZ family protein [Vibrio sp. V27_P1S3P104]|uniref:YigZ family protein n=1 Tax=unclassified Vibrio TaxID=2614977 RepID=UPI001372809A|nr:MULTISPECIES: YigZ family protein [unclassified Vibrio]NAW70013.1 YigZ family protein [Vibrio sp. V28_P6S34P95]NAX03612.1 YigZ family protein [Vibrio sp. V30_P3S12P165]NAX35882.1 YigZ family protein [Vibrio sp. V29_P1S30P107]NAX38985.1 YigZ family protein [Vibrio sp. V27_P1S3P104]NAX40349.1 YigZ family protein [Vibrio sp. V26_P1S5P106]